MVRPSSNHRVETRGEASKMHQRLRQAKSASTLIKPSPYALRSNAENALLRSASRPQLSAMRRPKKKCPKETALYDAYRAANALLGTSSKLHMPRAIVEPPVPAEPPATESLTEEEKLQKHEQELVEKIRTLERQLVNVQKMTVLVNENKAKRIREMDRVLFNARCGLELMNELAKGMRRSACTRALRLREAKEARPTTPAFIQMLNDERAKSLIMKHTKAVSNAKRHVPTVVEPRRVDETPQITTRPSAVSPCGT